jgi:DNA-binding transcriptional regulator YiaG
MATFAAALRTEFHRLMNRDIQRATRPVRRMRRQLQALRAANRAQKLTINKLERKLAKVQERVRWQSGTGRGLAAGSKPQIHPPEILTLRKRLRLSRLKFSKLVGVSPGSIFGWEHGRTQPRGESVKRLRLLEKRAAGNTPTRKRAEKTKAKRVPRRKPARRKSRR